MIDVLVPVLGRPQRAAPLVESIRENSQHVGRIVFLVTDGDDEQQAACLATDETTVVVPFPLDGGDYARKINHGILCTDAPWILQAGDDLRFHPRWDVEALALAARASAARVIGTNDLGNPLVKAGKHSTHSLISREYIETLGTVDEPGKALHEGYWHCWVDNELVGTAVARRAYWSARRSRVEHLHPIWRDREGPGGRKAVDDETYRRGQQRYHEDHLLFLERRKLWR